jgi:mersacidin/lichenicidin family type 2 lantibiotic
MTNEMIIRAWKSESYRESLSAAERAALPAHPAGAIELEDDLLDNVVGGLTLLLTPLLPTAPNTTGCSGLCTPQVTEVACEI